MEAITWVSGRVVPLKDDAGAVTGYLGAIEDITGFKLAQEELQSANDFLEHVLNSSPDAIGIVNQRGRFTKWHKMAEEVFGYHFDELKGGSFSELYADKHEMEPSSRGAAALQRYRIPDPLSCAHRAQDIAWPADPAAGVPESPVIEFRLFHE